MGSSRARPRTRSTSNPIGASRTGPGSTAALSPPPQSGGVHRLSVRRVGLRVKNGSLGSRSHCGRRCSVRGSARCYLGVMSVVVDCTRRRSFSMASGALRIMLGTGAGAHNRADIRTRRGLSLRACGGRRALADGHGSGGGLGHRSACDGGQNGGGKEAEDSGVHGELSFCRYPA